MDPMTHMQYMPGDLRLVDQILLELKSKGIFDQFRKDCISDVDTRPAYQNLRQRVESSVTGFLSRQHWVPDMNKNQMREKLRKHILDGNYLEQGVERIVDQVVNPKVNTVFKPQVEDLVYNYFGVERPKPAEVEKNVTVIDLTDNSLLPNDLEAVSPESNHGDKEMVGADEEKMDVDKTPTFEPVNENISMPAEESISGIIDLTLEEKVEMPTVINVQDIPLPNDTPRELNIEEIELPKDVYEEEIPSSIPLPDDMSDEDINELTSEFKSIGSDNDSDSSSNSSLRRNMSPLTPICNFDNDNSCDAKLGFDSPQNKDESKEASVTPSAFRFTIESKDMDSDNSKSEKKEESYKVSNQISMTTFSTPLLQAYDDSSDSNNLHIDYESDNSKLNDVKVGDPEHSDNSKTKKDTRDEKKNHSSHSSREKSRDKDRRSESKHSAPRDSRSSRHDRKSSRDNGKYKSRESNHKDDRKAHDKHKHASHKSKEHRSSSHHSSSKHDEKKYSSHKTTESKSKDHRSSKDSHSSSRSKDGKSSTKKRSDDKDKKDKKSSDDHYSASGRGNNSRRSTDRDSNDGNSTSSKGSNVQSTSKSSSKRNSKSSSKSEPTSSSDTTGQSDNIDVIYTNVANKDNPKPPIIRVDSHLETPICQAPHLPFTDINIKKPKFAVNYEEACEMMKLRNELNAEERKKNQDAALLLEFQQNVRPNMSQVYSNICGPELEFAYTDLNPVVENEGTVSPKVELESNLETFDIENAMFELHGEAGSNDEVESTSSAIDNDVSSIVEDLSESDDTIQSLADDSSTHEPELRYFTDEERKCSQIESDKLVQFYKKISVNKELCLLNCDENTCRVFEDISSELVDYKVRIISRSKKRDHVKDVELKTEEVTLPVQYYDEEFSSPMKDYDTKITEMVRKKTRQEIMDIILGDVIAEGSPSKMPKINFGKELFTWSCVDKRKLSFDNDNNNILSPNKIRKNSDSDQISSTVQDPVQYKSSVALRSKYIGKAKRVGLPKPRKVALSSSPSSDKSVENYEITSSPATGSTVNGKMKLRKHLIQRYETSDLYKPKLHYLSKRHNMTS